MPLKIQTSGEYQNEPLIVVSSYTYGFLEAPPYPLETGKEYRVIELETTTSTITGRESTETETNTYTYRVEGIEEITVPAGTFRCFKVVKYDEDDTAISTNWTSDKVKSDVKSIHHEAAELMELISFAVVPFPAGPTSLD
jgi:hypothetical protein